MTLDYPQGFQVRNLDFSLPVYPLKPYYMPLIWEVVLVIRTGVQVFMWILLLVG